MNKSKAFFPILFSMLMSGPSYALNLSVSELSSGKLTIVKVLDNGVDVTKDYNLSSSDVSVSVFAGKQALMGKEAGSKTITATKKSNTSITEQLSVTVIPGTASKLIIESGNEQTAAVNEVLPQPLKVKVIDSYNNGVAGVQVQFTSAAYSLEQFSPTVTTNTQGLAQVNYTAGSKAGVNIIEAKAPIPLSRGRAVRFVAKVTEFSASAAKKIKIDSIPTAANVNASFSVSASVISWSDLAFTEPRTLSIASYKNSSCTSLSDAVITGILSKPTVNGSVTFDNLSIKKPAYVFIGIKSDGIPVACSSRVMVKEDQTQSGPESVVFSAVPSSALEGSSFFPSVGINLRKANGFFYNQATPVTITAHTSSDCSVESQTELQGLKSRTAVLGRTSFSGLSVASPKTIYLKATTSGQKQVSTCSSPIVIKSKNPAANLPSIVGVWSHSTTSSIEFLSDNTYMYVKTPSYFGAPSGTERGSYTYNASTGDFSFSVIEDNNGAEGLSSLAGSVVKLQMASNGSVLDIIKNGTNNGFFQKAAIPQTPEVSPVKALQAYLEVTMDRNLDGASQYFIWRQIVEPNGTVRPETIDIYGMYLSSIFRDDHSVWDSTTGRKYIYKIVGKNAVGVSKLKTFEYIVPTFEKNLQSPQNISNILNGSTVTISWTAPNNIDQSKAYYKVYTIRGGKTQNFAWSYSNSASGTVSQGETYEFFVIAKEGTNVSPASAHTTVSVPVSPLVPPINVRALVNPQIPDYVEVTWEHAPGSTAAKYIIYMWEEGLDYPVGGGRMTHDGSAWSELDWSTREPGKTYYYTVRAMDVNYNESEDSARAYLESF